MNYPVFPLPHLHVDPITITVSGNSVGGQFAQDLAIIFSSEISGAGIIGSGSYNNEKTSYKKYILGKTSYEMAK